MAEGFLPLGGDNSLRLILEPVAEHRTDRVMRWIEKYHWTVTGPYGKTMDLGTLDLEHLDDRVRSELANNICNELRAEIDEYQLRANNSDAAPPMADAAKQHRPQAAPATTTPKSRQNVSKDPEREVDDETLAREVLKFLRDH